MDSLRADCLVGLRAEKMAGKMTMVGKRVLMKAGLRAEKRVDWIA